MRWMCRGRRNLLVLENLFPILLKKRQDLCQSQAIAQQNIMLILHVG